MAKKKEKDLSKLTGRERSLANLTPWKKGQSGNPNGPRKRIHTEIVDKVHEMGRAVATKADVEETFMALFSLPMSEVDRIAGKKLDPDNKNAMLLRLCANVLVSASPEKMMKLMLEFGIGKATQRHEIRGDMTHEISFMDPKGGPPRIYSSRPGVEDVDHEELND